MKTIDNVNVKQIKKQALYLVKQAQRKANRHIDTREAKKETVAFLGKATKEIKTQVDQHQKVLIIVGAVVFAKTAFDLIRKSKARKAGCCNGNCNCVLRK